jgi:diguanylate cyclase (GGDEF)-like protein
MQKKMLARSVGLRRKLVILYGLTFVVPMLFMVATVIHLVGGLDIDQARLAGARWSMGVGLAGSLVVSAGSMCFLYPSVRTIEVVARNAESFVRESGGDRGLHIVSTGDEAEKLANYTNQMIKELKEKLSDIGKCADELDAASRNLTQCAVTDGLTGLYNQTFIKERLSKEIEDAESTGRPVSTIMLDVNGFKRYNDSYGHLQGDKVLKQIARVLSDSLRGADLAARYGGDEFLVVLPDTERIAARKVAERIRNEVSNHRLGAVGASDTTVIQVTAGVASYPIDAGSVEELIQKADTGLYRQRGTQIVPVSEIRRDVKTEQPALAAAS